MSSSAIKMLKNIFTSHGGCGCGGPKPEEVFEPKPKAELEATSFDHDQNRPASLRNHSVHSSSSSWERGLGNSIDDDDDHTSTTYSFNNNNDTSTNGSEHGPHDPSCRSKMVVRPFPKFGDSVAVIKDSDDPYQDFRQSMLQMILEREIYSKDDLRELLNSFLELNSSSHHKIIVQAFMDIWNGVVSRKPKYIPASRSN